MGYKNFESKRKAKRRRQQKRNWIFLALGGVFLLGVAFLLMQGNQKSFPPATIEVYGAPSLKVDQEKVDLGNVQLGQLVKVSFRLTNVGDQTLQFSEQPYIEVVEGC